MINRLCNITALVFLFCSCEPQAQKKSPDPEMELSGNQDFKATNSIEKKTSWLTPEYLIADFNGDGFTDSAIAVVVKNKRGVKIKHGNTNQEYLIGAGNDFGNGGDDFDWVDNWKLVTEKSTSEVTFNENDEIEGSREVKLDSPAFYIGSEESGGATIAWKEGKYIWIHQAD